MLARAHASLHQWKEAQGELLRVVKVDRSSRQGFALLGEVLLRRSGLRARRAGAAARAEPRSDEPADPVDAQARARRPAARSAAADPAAGAAARRDRQRPARSTLAAARPRAARPRRPPMPRADGNAPPSSPAASPAMPTMAIEPRRTGATSRRPSTRRRRASPTRRPGSPHRPRAPSRPRPAADERRGRAAARGLGREAAERRGRVAAPVGRGRRELPQRSAHRRPARRRRRARARRRLRSAAGSPVGPLDAPRVHLPVRRARPRHRRRRHLVLVEREAEGRGGRAAAARGEERDRQRRLRRPRDLHREARRGAQEGPGEHPVVRVRRRGAPGLESLLYGTDAEPRRRARSTTSPTRSRTASPARASS